MDGLYMKKNEAIAVVLLFLATVGTVAAVLGVEGVRRNRLYTAQLTVRAPEFGNFYPQTVVVPAGEEVRIFLRNIDTVSHGFAVPDLGIAIPEIKAGETKIVTFTADEAGSYPFMCTVWCSVRHMEMRGTLLVE